MKAIKYILIFTMLSSTAVAQRKYDQTLYWLRFQNQLIFSPSLYWNNEIDNRRFIGPDIQHQLIYHSRLHYKKGRWDFAGGLTWSNAYQSIPENGPRKPLAELRPVAEATYELPVWKGYLQTRVRVDNRFLQQARDIPLLEESNYLMRFRYRLQVRFPLVKNDEHVTTVSMRIADEIMFNSEENFFDQNRIYVTTDVILSKHIALEFGYLHIYQQRFGREDFFSRDVLRFSVLHKAFVRP